MAQFHNPGQTQRHGRILDRVDRFGDIVEKFPVLGIFVMPEETDFDLVNILLRFFRKVCECG
jgi:hypothetical protein